MTNRRDDDYDCLIMIRTFAIQAFKDNYIWALIDDDRRQLVVVDPGDAQPVLAVIRAQGLRLAAILITHHHWDHTNGIKELVAEQPAPVYAPEAEAIGGATHPVREGMAIALPELGLSFTVLEVPGHTRGHVAYYGEGMLFCGDTLFAGGCGRLFEGTAEQMYRSLRRFAELPSNTRIYCAHEYTEANLRFATLVEPDNEALRARLAAVQAQRARGEITLPSTIAEELATNPFLRVDQPAVIESAERQAGQRLASAVEVFAAVRKWKDTA
mgnify:CR=1 FL=1